MASDISVLFREFNGVVSSELGTALQDSSVDVLFDSFLLERKERPGLLDLIKTEQTFKDYLSLPVECRAEVEELRLKDPEFLAGDFERDTPISLSQIPKGLSERAFFFFKNLHIENAVQRVVDAYIHHNPFSHIGPVPLKNWFYSYDVVSGKKTEGNHGCANKYVQQHFRDFKNPSEFDEWVFSKILPHQKELLSQTPYFKQKKFTIEYVVSVYINHQSSPDAKKVALKNWFSFYDVETWINVQKEGKVGQGHRFYGQYRRNSRKLNVSFDDWILNQLQPELKTQLLQTPHFSKAYNINDIARAYIKKSEESNKQTPLLHWFTHYDIETGELVPGRKAGQGQKYYKQFRSSNTKSEGIVFSEWILDRLQPDVRSQLETVLESRNKYSANNIARAYLKQFENPDNKKITLQNWFRRYDMDANAMSTHGQGTKYFNRFESREAKNITFDEWILKQLSPDIEGQLRQILDSKQAAFSITDCVRAYIDNSPVCRKGPVTLQVWFNNYNMITGERIEQGEKRTLKHIARGCTFYSQFRKSGTEESFDDWVMNQLPSDLQIALAKTVYFEEKKYDLQYVVRSFIKFSPVSIKGIVPLPSWFSNYNQNTGEFVSSRKTRENETTITPGSKFHQQYRKSVAKSEGVSFDDWVLSQLEDDELKAQLQSTPYWRSKYDS